MDQFTPEQRSWVMSRIRSSETVPERLMRSCMHRRGWRFRKNVRAIPGCPDIVFPAQRVLVFVDGDFWHGYRYDEWRHKLSEYWRIKIEGNRRRDRRTTARLRREGWIVVRLWEHDIRLRIERCAERVEQRLLEAGAAPRRGIS